jgi:hypothetical protein
MTNTQRGVGHSFACTNPTATQPDNPPSVERPKLAHSWRKRSRPDLFADGQHLSDGPGHDRPTVDKDGYRWDQPPERWGQE